MATQPGRSAPYLPQQVAQLLCRGPAAGCGRYQGAPLQSQLDWCRWLQSTVLRPWLQYSPGAAGAALPLQVRLVLLRPLPPLRERQRPLHLQVGCGHTTAGTKLHTIALTHLLVGPEHKTCNTTSSTQLHTTTSTHFQVGNCRTTTVGKELHNCISTPVSRQWARLQQHNYTHLHQ